MSELWNRDGADNMEFPTIDKKQLIGEFPVYLGDIINKKYSEIEKLVKGACMAIIEKDKNDR